jgi:hypothetical protein
MPTEEKLDEIDAGHVHSLKKSLRCLGLKVSGFRFALFLKRNFNL